MLKQILLSLLISVPLLIAPSAQAGELVWTKQGSSEVAWYRSGSQRFLLQLADDGSIFYNDNSVLKEPPLEVIHAVYEKRQEERAAGHALSPQRLGFLNNPRYKRDFGGIKSTASLHIKNGQVWEVVDGKPSKVVIGPDGRIYVQDRALMQNAAYSLERNLDPRVFAELMEGYHESKSAKFARIKGNDSNQSNFLWSREHADTTLRKGTGMPHAKAASEPRLDPSHATGPHPSKAVPSPSFSSRRGVPSWVPTDGLGRYRKSLRRYPDPKEVDYTRIGLAPEYSRLRNRLDKKLIELTRMLSTGASSVQFDMGMAEARQISDDLQKHWAHSMIMPGLLNIEQRKRYDADLQDFEHVSIGARYLALHSALSAKKLSEHKRANATLPFFNTQSAVSISEKEDEALRAQAVEDLLEEAKPDSRYFLSVMRRLVELSPKYPELQKAIALRARAF